MVTGNIDRRPPGRPRGTPKTGGRIKGTPNKVTTEARAAANALVDDPVYRRKLAADLRKRKVHPTIEALLWYYAKGKPKEQVEVSGGGYVGLVVAAAQRMTNGSMPLQAPEPPAGVLPSASPSTEVED